MHKFCISFYTIYTVCCVIWTCVCNKAYYLQILSSSVRLDGDHQWTAIFRLLQRFSIGFKSGLWLGHSRIRPLCLGWVLMVIVLLSGEPSAQSALDQGFIKDISVLCSVQLSLNYDQYPSSSHWKTPAQNDAVTTMLHRWDGIGQVMSGAWFPQTVQSWFHQTRESCFSQSILVVLYIEGKSPLTAVV